MFKFLQKKKVKTCITVQYDVGFSNSLFIRGEGLPGLSWDKGVELKNSQSNEWVWETHENFCDGEFKILINDQIFELGENHKISAGSCTRLNPKFS